MHKSACLTSVADAVNVAHCAQLPTTRASQTPPSHDQQRSRRETQDTVFSEAGEAEWAVRARVVGEGIRVTMGVCRKCGLPEIPKEKSLDWAFNLAVDQHGMSQAKRVRYRARTEFLNPAKHRFTGFWCRLFSRKAISTARVAPSDAAAGGSGAREVVAASGVNSALHESGAAECTGSAAKLTGVGPRKDTRPPMSVRTAFARVQSTGIALFKCARSTMASSKHTCACDIMTWQTSLARCVTALWALRIEEELAAHACFHIRSPHVCRENEYKPSPGTGVVLPHSLIATFCDPAGCLRIVGLYLFGDGHLPFAVARAQSDRQTMVRLVAAEEEWPETSTHSQLDVRDSVLARVSAHVAVPVALDPCTSLWPAARCACANACSTGNCTCSDCIGVSAWQAVATASPSGICSSD